MWSNSIQSVKFNLAYLHVVLTEYINSCMVGLSYRTYWWTTLVVSGMLGILTAETRHTYGIWFSFGLMCITTLIWGTLIELGKHWLFVPRKDRNCTVVQDYNEG